MVNNPYFYSTLGTAPSTQIADSSDNPHSGLIKALSVGMTGNYALKSGNNFVLSIHSTGNSVTLTSGVVLRDGAFSAVAASGTLTLGTGGGANSTYSLIVVTNATPNVLAIRTTSTSNAVPAYTLGDIPVALVLYTGAYSTTEVQFLTTNQTANSFTAGYNDSGFTEGMTVSADADRTMLKNKGATRDVRVILGDDNANAKFEIYSDDDSDGDTGDTSRFSVSGLGAVNVPSLTASEIVISDASKNLVSAAVGTYPSLAELAHVKGVTGAVQTQLNTKLQTGLHTIWVPASAMYPNTTAGCSILTQVELTNGPEIKVLDFDDGATESAQFTVAFPKSWNEGVVKFKAYWCSAATDTDGVSWGLQACGMNDNETINLAFGSAAVVDDANQGAANELLVSPLSGEITINGTPAVEDLTFFQISRVHDDSNDTAAEDARLLGIKLYYTLDGVNDA